MLNWWVDISLSFTQNNHYVLWQNLSPNIVLHPQLFGTTDSADFQRPIAAEGVEESLEEKDRGNFLH